MFEQGRVERLGRLGKDDLLVLPRMDGTEDGWRRRWLAFFREDGFAGRRWLRVEDRVDGPRVQLEVVIEGEGLLVRLGREEDLDDDVELAPARLGYLERRLLDG